MNLSYDITLASLLAAVGLLGAAAAVGRDASSWVVLAFAVLALASLGWLLAAWIRFRRA
ncbi:MAG TPA: hypothetical protein VM712_07640 [Gaiellales bacterium]|nr:hypothetical protein [Gaiellales bacterium]